jgi:hypothetical protein
MGSGPTCHLASKNKPGAAILMSAYTSIKEAAKEKFGFLSAIVQEQFDNLSIIDQVKSPMFFIHGKQDSLISFTHSERLRSKCKCNSEIILPEMMTHNEFDFFKDLIRPILKFFSKINLSTTQNERIISMVIKDMYYTDQDFVRIIRWERMKNTKKRKPRPADGKSI